MKLLKRQHFNSSEPVLDWGFCFLFSLGFDFCVLPVCSRDTVLFTMILFNYYHNYYYSYYYHDYYGY